MKRKNIYVTLLGVLLLMLYTPVNAKSNEALFNKLTKSYVLNADGSQQMRYTQEVTIYTHTAMRFYGQSFVIYNPNFQEVIINESYTKQVDGTIITTPENAYINVLPSSAANAPAYNHLIEKVMVHTGLELGATIYLDYTLKTKAGYLPALDVFEEVNEKSPVKSYEMKITVPKGSPLNYASINADRKPRFEEKEGNKIVTWKLRNLSASSREPGVTVQSGGVEILSINTYKSLEAEETFASLLDSDSDVIKKLLMGIFRTKLVLSECEKVSAIQKYVKSNYSLIPLSLKNAGYKIRSVSEVVKSAYGTEVELTQLMYWLLKGEKIDAEIVASYPVEEYNDAFGLGAVNGLFISANGSITSVKGVSPTEMEYKTLKVLTSKDALELTPQKTEIYSQQNLKMSEKSAKSIGNDYYLYTLADSTAGVVYDPYLKYNSARKENLLLPYEIKETYVYDIELVGLTLSSEIKDKHIKNRAGEVHISMKKDGNKLSITRKIDITSQMITPELYPYFRALILAWGDDNSRKLLGVKVQ